MGYNEKKFEMEKKGKKLLEEYDKLFLDTMFFMSELGNLPDKEKFNFIEGLKWMDFIFSDEDVVKITRLAVALQYVNEPTNKEVIDSLKENIKTNAVDARTKKR